MNSNLPLRTFYDHSFLAEELLVPNVDKCDGGRTNMFISHSSQVVTVNNAEIPKVFTRFENQVGLASSGYVGVESPTKVIKIIQMYGDNKLIVLQNLETGIYDIIPYNKVTSLTEHYGYDNFINEKVKEGEVFDPSIGDKWLIRNNMFDDQLNLKYGVNLKTGFIPKDGQTFEDAIVISETGASKLSHTEVYEYLIAVNRNDVLIDQSGVDRGDELLSTIKDGVLFARRRINYNTVIPDFKQNAFKKIDSLNDAVYFASGDVVDVTIYSNLLNDVPYNSPIKNVLVKQFKSYSELFDVCNSIKENPESKVTDNFNFYFNKARNYLNGENAEEGNAIPYSLDGKVYEGVVLKILVRKEYPCKVGDKLTGR
ncbi:hypothetical protein [Proteus mirabilis]|uniref:hypothetical protein n=1 Tax=Proteus mirabilis TaxID=584 RepID=UPI0034D7735A